MNVFIEKYKEMASWSKDHLLNLATVDAYYIGRVQECIENDRIEKAKEDLKAYTEYLEYRKQSYQTR